jgi:type IV pilus assembly protein PilB
MQLSSEKLKELLVGPGHIAEADFESVVKATGKDQDLAELLVDRNLIKDEQMGQLISEEAGVPFINFKNQRIDEQVFELIPELVAKSKGIIAFAQDESGLKLAMRDPGDLEMRQIVEKKAGVTVLPYYMTMQDWQTALERYQAGIKDEFEELLAQLRDAELSRETRDEVIVTMVDQLLKYGYQNKASDIHIEPLREKTLIRFRIDGVLHDVLDVPKDLSELILTRIKILSRLRTDEHRAAQDGKLTFDTEQLTSDSQGSGARGRVSSTAERVDVRVSIVPVTAGENVVMRLLSAKSRQFNLESLGLGEKDFTTLKHAIKNPHGMILVTGPTGSGKSTTLYAVMKLLNKREVHISTIEDPVEYDVEGISQIQVNTKTNLTFARGLRAIVRQDPDIIMVGEIRDEETAGIAVNSAMTGHLVLSTLHTNDAATTLPRLLDMGIEPFLVASTVNIAIAQRLVRKICQTCRASYEPEENELDLIPQDLKTALKARGQSLARLYRGTGCKVCGQTGYTGRVGVFEILEMSEAIKELILKRASSDDLAKAAREAGMTTMLEDGIEKVLQGITTLEEVMRVARE